MQEWGPEGTGWGCPAHQGYLEEVAFEIGS